MSVLYYMSKVLGEIISLEGQLVMCWFVCILQWSADLIVDTADQRKAWEMVSCTAVWYLQYTSWTHAQFPLTSWKNIKVSITQVMSDYVSWVLFITTLTMFFTWADSDRWVNLNKSNFSVPLSSLYSMWYSCNIYYTVISIYLGKHLLKGEGVKVKFSRNT